MSFVTSPFGSLANDLLATDSTSPSSSATTTTIHRLCFEHGDLVIKLDHEPRNWLIIRSKIFAAVSQVFRASTSEAWKETAQLDIIKHPHTGKDVEVRTLALKRVDDTYILEGKDVILQAEEGSTTRAVPFHLSSLATGNAPDLTGTSHDLANNGEHTTFDPSESARALHVFFAIIYGTPITLKHTPGEKRITPYLLLDICAYADFWRCFATLKLYLANALLATKKKTLTRDVAHNPQAYALLAKKLALEDIHTDALRHLVGNAYTDDLRVSDSGDWATIAEIMELDLEEVLDIFPWQLDWTHEPGARPPADALKLEGKGWWDWQVPSPAKVYHSEDVWRGKYTHLAVPVSRLPWKKEVKGMVEGEESVDLRLLRRGVSVEAASGAWVWEIVARLGE